MLMRMTVGPIHRSILGMLMLMMLVVGMAVSVLERQMLMFVLMAFREMQPDPENHKGCCQPKQQRYRLPQHQNGNRRAQKRRCRKIRSGSRSPQAA